MYKALDIAKYVINYCIDNNIEITNLKLQKLLYFLWVGYYKATKESLFEDEICAWKLGPVVPDVYYEYCAYAGAPIIRKAAVNIPDNDRRILDDILKRYTKYTAARLVDETHKDGLSWSKTYNNGKGNREVIPFPLIKQDAI